MDAKTACASILRFAGRLRCGGRDSNPQAVSRATDPKSAVSPVAPPPLAVCHRTGLPAQLVRESPEPPVRRAPLGATYWSPHGSSGTGAADSPCGRRSASWGLGESWRGWSRVVVRQWAARAGKIASTSRGRGGVVRGMRACFVSRRALTGAAIPPPLLVESIVTFHQHNGQPGEPTQSPHQALFWNSLTCLAGRPMGGPVLAVFGLAAGDGPLSGREGRGSSGQVLGTRLNGCPEAADRGSRTCGEMQLHGRRGLREVSRAHSATDGRLLSGGVTRSRHLHLEFCSSCRHTLSLDQGFHLCRKGHCTVLQRTARQGDSTVQGDRSYAT